MYGMWYWQQEVVQLYSATCIYILKNHIKGFIHLQASCIATMESSHSKTAEESSNYTPLHSELVTGMEHSTVTVFSVQEKRPFCNSVMVLAHSDIPVKNQTVVMETEPCSSGVVVLLHCDVPVQREV